MSKVASSKKQHRSMRGKTVDMDLLRKRNELTPAVGNARVNARGDELGPGGKIIKKRDEVVQDHYAQSGRAVESTGRAKTASKVSETVEPAVEPAKKTVTRTKKEEVTIAEPLTPAEQEMLDEADAWVEDTDGNFIQKGV
jgi:hypothetical protein